MRQTPQKPVRKSHPFGSDEIFPKSFDIQGFVFSPAAGNSAVLLKRHRPGHFTYEPQVRRPLPPLPHQNKQAYKYYFLLVRLI